MKSLPIKTVLIAVLSFFIISTSFAVDQIPFADGELKKFLSNKSYPLGGNTLGNSEGAFYFHPDGRLDALWKGKKETTTWKVEQGSKFCYTLKIFGGRDCTTLLKDIKTGGYVHVYGDKKRKLAKNAIVSGKQF